ncbi:MAG: hypothetical protein K2F72_04420, partial [Muribaculaceae bacterium]|nr:hypothetical protein [Muribaculaceae bacterium]
CGADFGFKPLLTAELLYFLLFYNVYTPSSQIGYLWMFTLVLLWVLAFRRASCASPWIAVPAFILGVLAGNGNEALNVGFAMALALWCLRHRKELNLCRVALAGGFAAGCALLVLSPGNFARVGTAFAEPVQLVAKVVYGIPLIFPVAMVVRRVRRGEKIRALYSENELWWNVYLGCVLFTAVLGILSNRVLFGAYLATIILIIRMSPGRSASPLWLAAMCVVCVVFYIDGIRYSYVQSKRYEMLHAVYAENQHKPVRVPPPLRKPVRPYGLACNRYFPDLETDQYFKSVRRLWAAGNPGAPLLRLLPDGLPEITDTVAEAYALRTADDYWWAVRPKESGTGFRCYYSVGIGPLRKHYAEIPLSFENPEVTTPLWEAKLMSSDTYLGMLKTDSITVVPAQNR